MKNYKYTKETTKFFPYSVFPDDHFSEIKRTLNWYLTEQVKKDDDEEIYERALRDY